MAAAQKHRQALIDASVTLFRRQGYAATGLAEILSASGAPRGSLYHYFPEGKEAIGEAALQEAAAATAARIEAAAARGIDPRQVVRNMAQTMATNLEESGYTASCPIANVAMETCGRSDRLGAASRAAIDSWTTALTHVFAAAGLPAGRASTLADFALGAIEGALMLARVRGSTAPLHATAAEIIRGIDRELPPKG
jgi:TetR/AcrR family transcriptional repressor of lmrAB and yxaGH operons